MAIPPLFKVVLCMAPFILISLWAIWHAFKHYFDTPQERKLWVLFVVFVPVFGGLLYLFAGRRRARGKIA